MKVFKELVPSLTKSYLLRNKSVDQLIKNKTFDAPLVVSLTSFGSRIGKADIAIRSILNQSYLPEKIILNVNHGFKDRISSRLQALESDKFEIRFVDQQCPHMKLLPTLERFPNKVIVTVDDDAIYPPNLIENLYQEHLKFPEKIIANYVRVIGYDKVGNLKPYKSWEHNGVSSNPKLYLPIGVGGVLFPPHVFDDEVFNVEHYMKLSPRADDLWFKMMGLRNGIEVKPLGQKPDTIYPIAGTQGQSLKSENVDKDRNSKQWQALMNFYDVDLGI